TDVLTCDAIPSAAIVSNTHGTERAIFMRSGMPGGSHTLDSAARPATTAKMPTTRPADSRPCSKLRKVCVNDIWAAHADQPEPPARVKSTTQDPIVAASAMMAAVAELSDIVAANSAIAPTRRP